MNDEWIEARFFIGLSASGREITATIAEMMLFDELPQIVRLSFYADNLCMDEMYQYLTAAEDAEVLRNTLTSLDLIAFIEDVN